MSTVKWQRIITYRTTTPDSLKIYSPKVRDDSFGSSSPRIASDCPGQSNFRGYTPDSPIIASPTSRDKPYGSLLSSVGLDVLDRATFLPISWLILQFEPMLIYNSLSRPLKSWFSFCSWRIFSGVVCDFRHSLLTIDNSGMISLASGSIGNGDVIAAFWPCLERRYAHREGEIMLVSPKKNHTCGVDVQCLDLTAVCSIHVIDLPVLCDVVARVLQSSSYLATHLRKMKRNGHFSAVVRFAMFLSMTVIPSLASQGESLPSNPVYKLLHLCDATKLRRFTLELMEFNLKLSQYNNDLLPDAFHYSKFIVASSVMHSLKTDSRFVSDSWISKQQYKVCRSSEETKYASLVNAAWELDWFSNRLFDLHIQLVYSVVMFSDNQTALVYHELQWQQFLPSISLQELSRDFAFTDHMIVARSGWFKSILDLLYCSLPRPPEAPCDFS